MEEQLQENTPFITQFVYPSTRYQLKMRVEYSDLSSKWSDGIEFKTPEFLACAWKECPDHIYEDKKYFVDKMNYIFATLFNLGFCIIVGNTLLPLNRVISWNIKIIESKLKDNDEW